MPREIDCSRPGFVRKKPSCVFSPVQNLKTNLKFIYFFIISLAKPPMANGTTTNIRKLKYPLGHIFYINLTRFITGIILSATPFRPSIKFSN